MITVAERWCKLCEEVRKHAISCGRDPQDITIIAASKYATIEQMREAYQAGCRHFGENRVQDALIKQEALSDLSITWHLIGTLQKNKVRKAVGRFALIHSIDSIELAQKISTVSQEEQKQTSILLEVNVSGEETKHGFAPIQLRAIFTQLIELPRLSINGLMTMAPDGVKAAVAQGHFAALRALNEELQEIAGAKAAMSNLSMGMTGDWRPAIAAGATFLRIGSALFS